MQTVYEAVESQGDTAKRRVNPVLFSRSGAHLLESRWRSPTLYEKRRAAPGPNPVAEGCGSTVAASPPRYVTLAWALRTAGTHGLIQRTTR